MNATALRGPSFLKKGATVPGVRLHLVDGTYELYRAHYSKRPDRPQKATVGLASSLLSLLDDAKEAVSHVAVAFDNPIRSFRNDLFDGYKSDEGVPPELRAQFDDAEEAARALGIVVWSMDRWENDDAPPMMCEVNCSGLFVKAYPSLENDLNPSTTHSFYFDQPEFWRDIQAVRTGRIFIVEPVYFERPGPRIVDGVAMLAEIFAPEGFVETSPPARWTPIIER